MISEYDTFILDKSLAIYRQVFFPIAILSLLFIAFEKSLLIAICLIIPMLILYFLGYLLTGLVTGLIFSDRVNYEHNIMILQREIKAGSLSEDEAEQMLKNRNNEPVSEPTKIIKFGPIIGTLGGVKMFEYLVAKMDKTGDEIRFEYSGPTVSAKGDSETAELRWYIDFEGMRYVRE